jgi:ATP-binding cassette subfamily F protein uup
VKKLSYMELRELDEMEAKIATAEAALAAAEAKAHAPDAPTDWQRSHDLFAAVEAAQKQVQSLYARWEALEARRS